MHDTHVNGEIKQMAHSLISESPPGAVRKKEISYVTQQFGHQKVSGYKIFLYPPPETFKGKRQGIPSGLQILIPFYAGLICLLGAGSQLL